MGIHWRLVDFLLVERGIVQNTALYSDLYLQVRKKSPIANIYPTNCQMDSSGSSE